MNSQYAFPGIAFFTNVTLEGFILKVSSFVVVEVPVRFETRTAAGVITSVRSLASVNAVVSPEISLFIKRFRTVRERAFIWPKFFLTVKNFYVGPVVDFQPALSGVFLPAVFVFAGKWLFCLVVRVLVAFFVSQSVKTLRTEVALIRFIVALQ